MVGDIREIQLSLNPFFNDLDYHIGKVSTSLHFI